MRRAALTIGVVLIIALAAVAHGQSEVFPVAYLPVIASHDPIPTPTPIPPTATPLPRGVIPNGNFELGLAYWVEFSDFEYPLIRTTFPGTARPHSGAWAAWLGGVYSEDDDDLTATAIAQPIIIDPGKPYLSYWHWIASADACGYDVGGVLLDNGGPSSIVVDAFDLCSKNSTNGWKRRVLDLRPYAGQAVGLYFLVGTDDLLNSNWFIDDVTVQSKATTLDEEVPQASEGVTVAHAPAPASTRVRIQQEGDVQERLLQLAQRTLP